MEKQNKTKKTKPLDSCRLNLYDNLFHYIYIVSTIITTKYLSHKVKFRRKSSYKFSYILFTYIPIYHKLPSEIIFTLQSLKLRSISKNKIKSVLNYDWKRPN